MQKAISGLGYLLPFILAEAGWPEVFFKRYFPVLGPEFGLGALGIFQGL